MAAAAEQLEADAKDTVYSLTDDVQLPLEEFVNVHILPQSVSIAGGMFISPDVMIARGDVLLLHGKAPISVTLSFPAQNTSSKHEVVVSPDIPVKFLVLPPKDSVQSDPKSQNGESGRPSSIVTYPTVADLLMDCPTYFEANSTYDDPYLPGFSVKPGDRFRYVKVVTDVAGDRMERLQCRTESGELVCLSTRCKGNFTVLRDDTPYSLRQLITQGKVPRRLMLAPDNNFQVSGLEENTANEDLDLEVLKLFRSFSGTLTMSRPVEKLEASPWDNPDIRWSLPIDASLHVRLFSDTDYEEPVTSRKVKPQSLAAFVNQHEHMLPVQATVFAYTTPPDEISKCLSNSREIIIHELLHTHKVFAKESKKNNYFVIDQSVQISFVQIPRTFSSIFEMMSLPLGSEVRVLADIAADFPEPFILHYGDLLRVTKHDSFSWKFKHSFTGDVPIVKCERIVQGGKSEKLKLPLDLEVSLVLHEDPSKLKVTNLADILSGEEEVPRGEVSVLEGNGASYPPLPASLHILQVLPECELLISPLSATAAISPLIKACAKIPLRHKVQLVLKRKLEFPDGYFVMPSSRHYISLGIESVTESDYEELVQAQKVATDYEDITISRPHGTEDDTRSQASSSGRSHYTVQSEAEAIPSSSAGTLEQKRNKDRVKRISRALNPKNWRLARGTTAAVNDQEETTAPPVTPVAGILTLALQPSQADDNEYSEIQAESLDDVEDFLQKHDGGNGEGFGDSVYEDINVTSVGQSAGAAQSRSVEGSSRQPLPEVCSHFHRPPQGKKNTSKDCGHKRRKTEPNIIVSEERDVQRTLWSAGRTDRERKLQGNFSDIEPSEENSAAVTSVGHARIKHPDSSDRHENSRRARSADRGRELSRDRHKDRAPPVPERRRKDLANNSDPENKTETPLTPKHKKQYLEQEPERSDRRKMKGSSSVCSSGERRQESYSDSSSEKSVGHEKQRRAQSPVTPPSGHHRCARQRKVLSPDSSSTTPRRPERRKKTDSSESAPLGDPSNSERQKRVGSPGCSTRIPTIPEKQGSPDISDTRKKTATQTPERQQGTESSDCFSSDLPQRQREVEQSTSISMDNNISNRLLTSSPEQPSKHSKLPEKRKDADLSDYMTVYPLKSDKPRKAMPLGDSTQPSETTEKEKEKEPDYLTIYPQRSDRQPKAKSQEHKSEKPHLPEKDRVSPELASESISTCERLECQQPDLSDTPQQQRRDYHSETVDVGIVERVKKSQSPNRNLEHSQQKRVSPGGVARPRRPRRKLDAGSEKLTDRSMDSLDSNVKGSSDDLLLTNVKGSSDDLLLTKQCDRPRTENVAARNNGGACDKPIVPPKPAFAITSGNTATKPKTGYRPVAPPRKRAERIGSTEAEMYSEGLGPKPVLGRKRMQ